MRLAALNGLMLVLATSVAAQVAAQEVENDGTAALASEAPSVEAASEAPSATGWQDMEAMGQAYDFRADGSRIVVEGRGFTITPPAGWEVYTKHPTLSLLLQVPFKEGMRYRRTIQVASFSGPKYMDEVTAKQFEGLIVKKFSAASANIENFRVRNHMGIDLADGRKGLLFYTEMKIDGVDLMQAHILVSSNSRHYLMTYTDVREHFEEDASGKFLTEAWDAMISVELDGPTPQRFDAMAQIGVGVGALLGVLLLLWGTRQLLARRALAAYTRGGGGRGDQDDDNDDEMEFRTDASVSAPASGHDSGHGLDDDEQDGDERASKRAAGKGKVKAEADYPQLPSTPEKPLRSGNAALVAKSGKRKQSGKRGWQADAKQPISGAETSISEPALSGFSQFDDDDQAV